VPTSDINWTRLVICILIESYPPKMDNRIKAEAHDVMLVNRTGVGCGCYHFRLYFRKVVIYLFYVYGVHFLLVNFVVCYKNAFL